MSEAVETPRVVSEGEDAVEEGSDRDMPTIFEEPEENSSEA